MIKEKREDRIVANQFNILIPVGIAIIDVGTPQILNLCKAIVKIVLFLA